MRWRLDSGSGVYDRDPHLGGLSERFVGVAAAAINPAGNLAGVVTSVNVAHMAWVHDSAFVLRLEDGHELFRRHLELGMAGGPFGPVVVFLGDRHLAFSHQGHMRVFQIPSDLP